MSSFSTKTLFTFIYKLAFSAIGFINGALVGRYLIDKADRYNFQFAGNVATTGMYFVGGYTGYYAYALPKDPDEAKQIVEMGNLFVLMASLVIWVIAAVSRIFLFPHLPHYWWLPLVWWAIVCTPFNFIFGYGSRLLQGVNHMTALNRVNMLQPVLFLLIYVPLFFDRHLPEHIRVWMTYGSWVVTWGVAALASLIVAYRFVRVRGFGGLRFHRKQWTGTMKYGGWLSISNFINYFYSRLDLYLAGVLMPHGLASSYGVAIAASEVLINLSGSVQQVVFTRMTGGSRVDAIGITELSTRHTFISSTIVAAGMLVAFPALIVLGYGARYGDAILPFILLLPGLVVRATGSMILQYATNQLGDPRITIWQNGIAAIIKAALCVLLMPAFRMVGASIATTLTYVAAYAIYVFWFSRVNQVSPKGLLAIRKSDLTPYLQLVGRGLRKLRRSA